MGCGNLKEDLIKQTCSFNSEIEMKKTHDCLTIKKRKKGNRFSLKDEDSDMKKSLNNSDRLISSLERD